MDAQASSSEHPETSKSGASQWQRAALERMFDALEAGAQPLAEHEQGIPVEEYRAPERFEAEQQAVFRRMPLAVGVSDQLRRPGDFITSESTGLPILVVRDRATSLRAFANVCRHRGARLVDAPCGSQRSLFACRYHGWSYDLDGRLCAIPHPGGFPTLDRSERSLARLGVVERSGLVFVHRSEQLGAELPPLEGAVLDQLASFDLGSRTVLARTTRHVRGNWKLLAETMLEAYHIPVLHRKTGGPAFQDNFVLFDPLPGPSGRFTLPLKGARRPLPDDDDWQLLFHAAILYWIFPNTFVFLFGPFAHVATLVPTSPSECTLRGIALIEPQHRDGPQRAAVDNLYSWYLATIEEDIEIVESVQTGLDSGANSMFLLGRYEFYIESFLHAPLRRALAGYAASRG